MDLTITATATDSLGRTQQASIVVVVVDDRYSDIYWGDF